MPTVNEALLDALVRHQIGLLRLAGSVRKRLLERIDASERRVVQVIRSQLATAKGIDDPGTVKRLKGLLGTLRRIRGKAWDEAAKIWGEELQNLAVAEARTVDGIVRAVSPVVLDTVVPPATILRRLVRQRPFEGRLLREWAADIKRADLRRIEDQIKIGLAQGEGANAIARRIVGTARLKGADGVTEISRRQATAITRTAVSAIGNGARREYFIANKELFDEELFVATLDARTTPVCRSLDGKRYPVGEGPIPPLHFNCRSIRVAAFDKQVIGERPERRFTQEQFVREFTKQQGLRQVSSRKALPRGYKGKYDAFARKRKRELTGTIPARTTYQDWLKRQPASFQDEVLGKTRGKLFRKGGLTLDRFVNRSGDEITLEQLARLDRDAFVSAGLNPEDFL